MVKKRAFESYENNSRCILKSHNRCVDNPITECQCPRGYSGRWCANDLCLSLNCQHNDICQRLPYEQTKCICTEQ